MKFLKAQLPWFSSMSQVPDYRTIEKIPITYWLSEAKAIRLTLRDENNKEIWATDLEGQKGFNQYRWDLIVSRETSDLPYFTQYEKYIQAGTYKMILSNGKSESVQTFIVKNRVSPYK